MLDQFSTEDLAIGLGILPIDQSQNIKSFEYKCEKAIYDKNIDLSLSNLHQFKQFFKRQVGTLDINDIQNLDGNKYNNSIKNLKSYIDNNSEKLKKSLNIKKNNKKNLWVDHNQEVIHHLFKNNNIFSKSNFCINKLNLLKIKNTLKNYFTLFFFKFSLIYCKFLLNFISIISKVFSHLKYTLLNSCSNQLSSLAENTNILLYYGQFGLFYGPPSITKWIESLKEPIKSSLQNGQKKIWKKKETTLGYFQNYKDFYFFIMVQMGSYIPDNDKIVRRINQLFYNFTRNIGFSENSLKKDEKNCKYLQSCNGNGNCIAGECICNKGFGLADCSEKIEEIM